MVYFPETGKPATADPKTVAAVWTERIDSEYREMPGLRLTLAQAARLGGLQAPQRRDEPRPHDAILRHVEGYWVFVSDQRDPDPALAG